jgi:1-acyl-sn-glycerol-3-phosphate acyltransferase
MTILRLLYRLPWLIVHIVLFLPPTVVTQTKLFRSMHLAGRRVSDIFLNWWSGTICTIFGLRRAVTGEFEPGAQLVVANHISWLDIQFLHSVSPMGFVAKAEIQKWPLAGWIAAFGDTVFHHRGSHDSATGVATVMAQRLAEGAKVAIFPEGGILPGKGIKRFHARMFAAALDTGTPVQPVMIRYLRNGRHEHGMTFLPGENFVANFFRLLGQEPCLAELAILPVIDATGMQRKDLANASELAIRSAYMLDVIGESGE